MKTSHWMLPALMFALLGAAAVGCGSSDSGGAAGGGGTPSTGGTGGNETGGAAGSATGGTGGSETGGTGGSETGGSAGSATGGSGGTGGTATCSETTEITITDIQYAGGDGASYVIYAGITSPTLGNADLPDYIQLEIYEDDNTGTFDLAAAPNDNYSTCAQCMHGVEDYDSAAGSVAREYFQTKGTLVIDDTTPPISGAVIKATLTDVTLMEATIDTSGTSPTYESTFVDNGKCLHIASATIDLGCGNNKIDAGEQCDGTEMGTLTCESVGYTAGTIACNDACRYDYAACTGWNCTATDLGTFAGADITQHGDTCTGTAVYDAEANGTSCTGYNTGGKELVYSLTVPANTAVQVVRNGSFDHALWVTTACDDITGAACAAGADPVSYPDVVTINNTTAADATYYVIVDAYGDATACGEFDLLVHTAPVKPDAWTCDANLYGAYDGCDCACGAWDPDCDIAGAAVFGCPNDTDICVKPDGTCQAQ